MAEALKLTLAQRRSRVRWPRRRKRDFLATLAETCDIAAACVAAGLDWIGICQLRAMDMQFAADWDAVTDALYARLEAAALREAGAAGDREVNAALARELLKQRGAASARKPGTMPKPPPPAPMPDRERRVADFMRQFRPADAPEQAREDHGPDGKLAALAARPEGGRADRAETGSGHAG